MDYSIDKGNDVSAAKVTLRLRMTVGGVMAVLTFLYGCVCYKAFVRPFKIDSIEVLYVFGVSPFIAFLVSAFFPRVRAYIGEIITIFFAPVCLGFTLFHFRIVSLSNYPFFIGAFAFLAVGIVLSERRRIFVPEVPESVGQTSSLAPSSNSEGNDSFEVNAGTSSGEASRILGTLIGWAVKLLVIYAAWVAIASAPPWAIFIMIILFYSMHRGS